MEINNNLGQFVTSISFDCLQFWETWLKDKNMSTLEATRAELALLILYLNKAEAKDKICMGGRRR